MDLTEANVREKLRGLPKQVVLIGCDHLVHDFSGPAIAELRGISLSTVRRSIALVLTTIAVAGASRPRPPRQNTRHVIRGFTSALSMAL